MTAQWAAIVFLGTLSILNLLLTFGVVRRLRAHTELLGDRREIPTPSPPVGAKIGDFSATTEDGEPIGHSSLAGAGESVVAFFSPSCAPCRDELPGFLEFARAFPGGRRRLLAVVVAESVDAEEAAEMVRALSPVAMVVAEGQRGAVTTAFGVRGYPSLLMVDAGRDGRLEVVDDRVRTSAALVADR